MTLKERIKTLMGYGILLKVIAQEAGIGYSTLRRWLAGDIEISEEKQAQVEYALQNIGTDIYSITNGGISPSAGDDLEAIIAGMNDNDE